MKDPRVALRYARALFSLAEERAQWEPLEEELKEAREIVERHPEISHLLRNATLSREEKEDFIEKVLPRSFSRLLINFLKLLIRKGRFQNLPLIQEKFHALYEEKKGLQRVRVEAAIPLDEALQEKLCEVLEKKINRKVYLQIALVPEILGGLVLDLEGRRIDGSLRRGLYELKERLLS